MHPPDFWYPDASPSPPTAKLLAAGLFPFATVYGWAGKLRAVLTTPETVPIPVICIGNLTLGGTGKTPLAMKVAEILKQHSPFFLTRGYGGQEKGPVRVTPDHSAHDIGDETILLARCAPTIVARNRPAGANLAVRSGAGCIIMDDGFQNPSLNKDFSILVIDGETGLGNGCIFPAGPMRESAQAGLARAQMVIVMSRGDKPNLPVALDRFSGPVLTGHTIAKPNPRLTGPLFAFAGIGRPDKFFNTLESAGHTIVETVPFPDHHIYTSKEMEDLIARAETQDARLVTTEKDAAKLAPSDLKNIEILQIDIAIDRQETLEAQLNALFTSSPNAATLLSNPQNTTGQEQT